jgi:transcriptional regulator GlxA family with amidase domain
MRSPFASLVLLVSCLSASGCEATSPSATPDESARSGKTVSSFPAATERRLNAGFLVVDGVYNTELTAPYDVLEHTQHHAPGGLGIEVFTVSPRGEPVTSAEGLRILPDYGFGDAPPIDILVVPSARESRGKNLENRELISWVRETGTEARIVISLCWGAFVLAEAGLLNGHACTTFPGDYDTFAGRFPLLDLHINVSFVHDGRILTSQGGARSFDVAMYLVDLLYGEEVARGVGRGLLIPWPPSREAGFLYLSQTSRDPGAARTSP